MKYEEVAKLAEELDYRDKLRLAQLLIQLARKEEEGQRPTRRKPSASVDTSASESITYVAERLLKLRPAKVSSLMNSIGAMFQFQGGISDADTEAIVTELQRRHYIVIDRNNRVSYTSLDSHSDTLPSRARRDESP